MRIGAKNELIEPKCNEGHIADHIGSLRESPNPMRQFRITTHPFLQLSLHDLLLGGNLNVTRVYITNNWQ